MSLVSPLRVLLAGSGGREHALAWSISRSPLLGRLYAAPGNPGIHTLAEPGPEDPDNHAATADWCRRHEIDLVVIGPEALLAGGLADAVEAAGIAVFGPSAAAARIESSKAYARELMTRAGVPQPEHAVFQQLEPALDYLKSLPGPGAVVKASGLAAGKGVIVCDSPEMAERAAREMLAEERFGSAGSTILIEERLTGPEVSLFVLSDGQRAIPLLPACDYKRLLDGDLGPNTGGMGSFAPALHMPAALVQQVMESIIRPTLRELALDGAPFRGCLYAGLMLTPAGPRVIEFNCRFGDPETQAVLPLLRSDLLELLYAAARGCLEEQPLHWSDERAVCVVLASEGYPGAIRDGLRITGLAEAEQQGCLVFQAGVRAKNGGLVTSGGRVLSCVGLGGSFPGAAARAYAAAGAIEFDGKQMRRDIGACEGVEE